MENMKLINQGRTAEIFDLGDRKILKLFRTNIESTAIEEEIFMANLLQAYHLPIPKFFGKTEHDGRIGLIYEYIQGPALSEGMLGRPPWALPAFGKQMAEIQARIHQEKIEPTLAPKFQQKYRLEWLIGHSNQLTIEMKNRIILYLKELPEGNSLCHGDMNPTNILLSEQGPVVIDWMNATSGNPAGDVARNIVMLKYGAINLPFLMDIFVRKLLPLFRSAYIRHYIKNTGIRRDEIKQWELPVAAAALSDNAPREETKRLLKFIRRRLKGIK